ncbi:hypothetical protein TNCV_1444641 [Trichonephila clavipes]|nr:hypothetical protein TNCV_1444641 [Trichonephila clavipes]
MGALGKTKFLVLLHIIRAQVPPSWAETGRQNYIAAIWEGRKLPEPEVGWTPRCTPVVGRSLEHHTGDRTIFLAWLHTNLEGEHPGKGEGPSSSLTLPPIKREDLRLDGYLDYLHAAKALCIYKHHPCLLRDSNTDPTT